MISGGLPRHRQEAKEQGRSDPDNYLVPNGASRSGSVPSKWKDNARSGQVRFITRPQPKSRTMRAKRNKRSRANRTNVPK
jgi:hypothetical protein